MSPPLRRRILRVEMWPYLPRHGQPSVPPWLLGLIIVTALAAFLVLTALLDPY